MKKLSLVLLLLCTSCSITVVWAPKEVCIHGDNNTPQITGSDLKDNKAQQSSAFDWILELPWK